MSLIRASSGICEEVSVLLNTLELEHYRPLQHRQRPSFTLPATTRLLTPPLRIPLPVSGIAGS